MKSYLVVLDGRKRLRNGYDQRMVGDVARVEHRRLVVEVDVVDALEVVTHDADGFLHACLVDDEIPVGITDVAYRGDTLGRLETVRIVDRVARCKHCETHDENTEISCN